VFILRGRRVLATSGDLPDWVAVEPTSGRTAVVTMPRLVVTGADRAVIAAADPPGAGAVAFEDRDHLLMLRDDTALTGLWRLDLVANSWAKLADLPSPGAALAAANGLVFACAGKSIHVVRSGHVVASHTLGEDVTTMTLSADRRWLAANTETGRTIVLDATTGAIDRYLAPLEPFGTEAFDAHGDLLIRGAEGRLGVWDRSDGTLLLSNIEFLRGPLGAAFDAQGRLEIAGPTIGRLEIAPDVRPVAEIVEAIECRVPLQVAEARLVPARRRCAARQ
jgi:hypothetical protein